MKSSCADWIPSSLPLLRKSNISLGTRPTCPGSRVPKKEAQGHETLPLEIRKQYRVRNLSLSVSGPGSPLACGVGGKHHPSMNVSTFRSF